jgi:hypothetical protein
VIEGDIETDTGTGRPIDFPFGEQDPGHRWAVIGRSNRRSRKVINANPEAKASRRWTIGSRPKEISIPGVYPVNLKSEVVCELRCSRCCSLRSRRGKHIDGYSKEALRTAFPPPVVYLLPLQGQLGGSGRKIIRLATETLSAIGILYDVREENLAFLNFSRHFRQHGLPVPEIYAEDLSHGAYLEEDLGNTTLFDFLSKNRAGVNIAPQATDAYRKVVAVLPRFQIEAGRDLNSAV